MDNLFSGRLARLNYFLASVVLFAFVATFDLIVTVLVLKNSSFELMAFSMVFILMAHIVYTFFAFSLSIRRLHDMNWSGWLSLLFLIPLVNLVLSFILLFKIGTEGNNKYGLEPKKDVDIFGTFWPSNTNAPAQVISTPQ